MIKDKIKEWEEWCNYDEDEMQDHLREFFSDTLTSKDLWDIIKLIKNNNFI